MKICKFEAATMQEAVAQVKRELGGDAMVVATRQVRRGLLGTGVEVTAAIDDPEEGPPPAPLGSYARTPAFTAVAPPRMTGPTPASSGVVAPVSGALADADVERIMAPLRSELRAIRSLVRSVAEPAGGDDMQRELAALRQAVAGLRGPTPAAPRPLEEIAAEATIAAPSTARIVAMVGPTGVGKTTTIAKLAARAALVDRQDVALITLDAYRVGGEAQIRTFADLIGVPLTTVSSYDALSTAILTHVERDKIFIDTAGRSPRDTAAMAELEAGLAQIDDVETHLCITAGSSATHIDGWLARYRTLVIDRLLFTKIDEADDLAELVRAPARLRRPISHLATGQRVPEDLEDASPARLLDLARRGLRDAEVAA